LVNGCISRLLDLSTRRVPPLCHDRSLDGRAASRDDSWTRRLAAVALLVTALAGAAYLGSLRLGSRPIFYYFINTGFTQPAHPVVCGTRSRAGWQIPVSILIGALGVAGGLVLLRTRRNDHLGSPSQAA
jgi:hypothetical protein